MNVDMPSLSVVIPAYNEAQLIDKCLSALAMQIDYIDEIIVVDNNCTDSTVQKALTYPKVRVVHEPQQGITYARYKGFESASSDIIARTDADSIAMPNWAQTIRDEFSNSRIDAIAGNYAIAELSPGKLFLASWYCRYLFRPWHQHSLGIKPMMYGPNAAFTKAAWNRSKHHLSFGDSTASEDVDVTLSFLAEGLTIKYMPKLLVKCYLLRTLKFHKLRRYYRTDNITLAKYKLGNKRRWR